VNPPGYRSDAADAAVRQGLPEASDASPSTNSPDAADVGRGADVGLEEPPAPPDTGAPEAAVVDVGAPDVHPVDPGGPLDGQRWELPCGSTMQSGLLCSDLPAQGTACMSGYDPIGKTVTFGGTPGSFYQVSLRFRGVVEPKNYVNGTSRGNHFYVGGRPASSVYNAYGFSVSSPMQTYYLNAADGQGEVTRPFVLDSTATVMIEGGATIKLFASDSDCAMLRNCEGTPSFNCTPMVVPGVPPAPVPFDGQFVQLNVTRVTP
jgi:hypothetical protein